MLHGSIPGKNTVYLWKHIIKTWGFFWVKLKVREALCSQNPSHLRLDEGAKAALKAVPGLQVGQCYPTASRHGCIYRWQMFDPLAPPAGPGSLSHSGGRQCQHQEFFGKLPSQVFCVDGKSGCNSERTSQEPLGLCPDKVPRGSVRFETPTPWGFRWHFFLTWICRMYR